MAYHQQLELDLDPERQHDDGHTTQRRRRARGQFFRSSRHFAELLWRAGLDDPTVDEAALDAAAVRFLGDYRRLVEHGVHA